MLICFLIAFPLGISMIVAGGLSINACGQPRVTSNTSDLVSDLDKEVVEDVYQMEKFYIPIWLLVAGCAVLLVVPVYYIYDAFCRADLGGPLVRGIANCIIVSFLMCGLVWAILGFLWVFGSHSNEVCGADSHTYRFAYATLIILNIIMDVWVCYKICVVLYWAFLSED